MTRKQSRGKMTKNRSKVEVLYHFLLKNKPRQSKDLNMTINKNSQKS